MKHLITLSLLIASLNAFSQSKSFQTIKEKFADSENVTSVSVGGFVLRTALWISGEDDIQNEFGKVKSVRLITIPQYEFEARDLKLSGFRKYLAKDDFEEMASVRGDGEHFTVYVQDHKNKSNLYFVLVENKDEVTAIEIKGYLDHEKLVKNYSKEKLTNL